MIPFIDLATQQACIKVQIDAAIQRVLAHGKYIMGPEVFELEEKLADYVGVKHCITCSSGTDSLLIAMMALGIGAGDEVITVPYTWISTAEMIALLGATPVFVDIQEDTFNMDPSKIESAITERTKAIIPVGIYGQTADMTAINKIANRHNLPVIEDAAQSFGATHHGKKSCSLSTIGSTSFFPSKPLGCYGDGGALFTDDNELAELMRQIRVHGQQKKHHHPILGVNGRLDTIQAAIILEKLEIFDREIDSRQRIADAYSKHLAEFPEITCPIVPPYNTSCWAQYTILVSDVDETQKKLAADSIPSVTYYSVPLHLQPVFNKCGEYSNLSVSETVAAAGLSLPMSAYLDSRIPVRLANQLSGATG